MRRIACRLDALVLVAPLIVAAPALGQTQPQARSAYPDGTGDAEVDRLNNGQLNANYRGWYYAPAGTPGTVPYGAAPPPPAPAPPGYGVPPYPQPYPQPAYPPAAYPPPRY